MTRRFSVVIPIEPEGKIEGTLDQLSRLDYPAEAIEVHVVRGRWFSKQWNVGRRAATGDIVYFLDSDSLVRPDLFQKVMALYDDPSVGIVGGPNVSPPGDSLIQQALDAVQSSWLGSYTVRARYRPIGTLRDTTEKELIGCNLSVRRSALEAVGGFNESLLYSAENEMMHRVQVAGSRLLYQPEAVVYRSRRKNLSQFAVQNFRYGRGRFHQMYVDISLGDLVHIIPAGWVLYLLLLPWLSHPLARAPFVAYLAACFLSSLVEAMLHRRFIFVLLLPWVFFVRHLAYGVGWFVGAAEMLWAGSYLRRLPTEEPVVQHVKMFGQKW